MQERKADISRVTGETNVHIAIDLDGTGKADIHTGIGFFDHMLNSFARHGLFDLTVDVKGDLEVDSHHTIEDTGIVLGQAIRRFGDCMLPMDETLMLCALDLSGRPYLKFYMPLTVPKVGDFDTEMVHEFFYAVSYGAEMNLHLKMLDGENNHHIIEAAFKAFAKALDKAVQYDDRIQEVLSTKGSL